MNARFKFTFYLGAAEENRLNLVLGQHRGGAIQEHEAQHPHHRVSRLTKTTDNDSYAVPAALPFARLAAQARSSAFLQAAVIFLLGF